MRLANEFETTVTFEFEITVTIERLNLLDDLITVTFDALVINALRLPDCYLTRINLYFGQRNYGLIGITDV